MNAFASSTRFSPHEYDALVTAAKARAQELQREAGQVFWRAFASALRHAVRRATQWLPARAPARQMEA